MKWIGLSVFLLLLSGCAGTDMIDHELPQNVTVTHKDVHMLGLLSWQTGGAFFDSVDFSHDGVPAERKLSPCVLRYVSNDAYEVRGSQQEMLGWGHYVNMPYYAKVGGGITLLSDKPDRVIAQGTYKFLNGDEQSHWINPLHVEIMSFMVDVQRDGSRVDLHFGSLRHAVTSSGDGPNPGFMDLGAWEKATPMRPYNSLKRLDEKIASCLTATDTAIRKAQ